MQKEFLIENSKHGDFKSMIHEFDFNWINVDLTFTNSKVSIYEFKRKTIKLKSNELPDWFNAGINLWNAESLTYTLYDSFWLSIKYNKTHEEDVKIIMNLDKNIHLNKTLKQIFEEIKNKLYNNKNACIK
jgi:hypothetical protein